MNLQSLRRKYPIFSYQNYNWQIEENDLVINWVMGNDEYQFHPQLRLLGASSKIKELPHEIIDNFVFHLGLVEIFSYWKAFCSPKIVVNAGYLDEQQLAWWKDLLLKGMGQYFYENEIVFTDKNFVTLNCHCETRQLAGLGNLINRLLRRPAPYGAGLLAMTKREYVRKKPLIAVGGGKDSAVTLELLTNRFWTSPVSYGDRASQNDVEKMGVFVLNTKKYPAIEKTVKVSKIKNITRVERTIDPRLLDLNSKGYLNGHTPFTAYLSFLGVFLAKLFDFEEVVFSNEKSSNEGNLEYLGFEINHQYSKTLEFENKFREYNKSYLSDVNYFSFLRPMYELQIMKIFSGLEKYFTSFLSCNSSKNWCGRCPKCLASFVGLYPFIEAEKMVAIFDRNLFSEKNLLPIASEMLGLGEKKPFECVGTLEETKIAFYLSFKKSDASDFPLLKFFLDRVMIKEKNWEERAKSILNDFDKNHNLPERYERILIKY